MSGFEVGSRVTVRAAHRMPDMPPPEGELHEHDYGIAVEVRRETLDERGMVCDLDVLGSALDALAARLRGRDLEEIGIPDVPAVTVEVLARWIHQALAEDIRAAGGEELAVRVWESDVAFGGYRDRLS
ncbi:MAG: 6-carboxytetrahydropterin synthase [Actinomycetota bacterium]|nr:6-carboxytetrahydropterin synthase [Actinomycetota bacterium]